MTRRLALVVLATVAAVATPSAAGSSAKGVAIQHGVGIGPIKLGMSGPDVRKRLGRPRAVIERRLIGGRPYVEFEYHFGAWNVGFLGRKGHRRVVLVGTGLPRHRSPEGVGVGTSERSFWRRVRGEGFVRRECDRPDPSGSLNNLFHWLRRGRSSETVFIPGGPQSSQEVASVEVRSSVTSGCGF